MKFCKLADISDWQDPEFEEIASLLMEAVQSRKAWEFVQIYRGLKQLGLLNGQSQALGLGVGHEGLIYAFTHVCQHVTATDLYESKEWTTAAMSVQDVYDKSPFPYQRDQLTVRHMDMTQIQYPDASFDFVWSCCAIEHVNDFRDLHQVYREIHRVLKPGGIAALTTEFNMTDRPSYEPNLLFTDRQWVESWLTGADPLIRGFELLDSPSFALSDRPENQPVSRKEPVASIQVYCNDIVLNSVAFFLRKAGEFDRGYDEQWLPQFWRDYLAACGAYRASEFEQSEVLLRQLLKEPLEPRLKVRALRRLADALFAQAKLDQTKLDQVRQVCQAALPDCEVFQDEDQLMPLAVYCQQTGLDEEARRLFEQVEHLLSANLELVIQSRFQPAPDY
jgi:SAM-dependent methyltransferase